MRLLAYGIDFLIYVKAWQAFGTLKHACISVGRGYAFQWARRRTRPRCPSPGNALVPFRAITKLRHRLAQKSRSKRTCAAIIETAHKQARNSEPRVQQQGIRSADAHTKRASKRARQTKSRTKALSRRSELQRLRAAQALLFLQARANKQNNFRSRVATKSARIFPLKFSCIFPNV